MQTKQEKLSSTKIKLSVTVDAGSLKIAREHAIKKLGKGVKVAGFRQGKAPANLVEKALDPSTLQTEFIDEAINHAYPKALDKENLRPVVSPKVSLTKFVPFTELEFSVEVEILGKIEPADYKKLSKARPLAAVVAKEIDDTIDNMRKQMAEKTEVKRKSKKGDEVWIDFNGTDETGEPVKGADGTDYPLLLGSNTFIPGFEDNVVGLSAEETKTFDLTFPNDYGVAALQGRKVTFTVTVKKVQEVSLPEVNDSFVAKVSPLKTVKELKADIKKQLSVEKQRQADNDFEAEIINELTAKSTVELPEGLLEEQADAVLNDLKRNLSYRGMTYDDYVKNAGTTDEEYRKKEILPEAERRLKAGLVLSEIAEREKITVLPEEIALRIENLKLQHQNDPRMMDELEKPENQRDIAARLLTEKTIVMVVEAATKK